ncbi:MAG: hypothetical protein ACTSQ8_12765 [Candidatus Helarchaeota archaeon]
MTQQSQLSNSSFLIPTEGSVTLENTTLRDQRIHQNVSVESSIYRFLQNAIEYIEEIYIFKNPIEIKSFLISNEDLIQILLDAQEHIHRVFGQTPIYLELHHDPEEEWDELFIVIKTQYSPEEAVSRENQLFEEWFAGILDNVGGRLNFTEEPL